ncbi:MAG TPA: DUF2242 domain-containing protein [Ideonella sp.]|uniref:DUF2242 domain-containing protein n=1 Tax=Ideonella sp. TaxID=1929293 RepID=UPI002E336BD4|nr:DUF2242 domain-containing protein [Ideonella sp.]HEX5682626.1 DUF2242 domain-containing protein [Ideonella sp.]
MHPRISLPLFRWALAAATLALAGGCTSTAPKLKVYQDEGFESSETFSRLFDAPVDLTCEAARRALLSQGYVVSVLKPDAINGTKSFQPEGDVHVQIEFHVVCAADGSNGKLATAYVSALQDRYALKKSPNSASLGVAAIGSLSIPFTASDDSLVKVASETIPAGPFYDRFFTLMHRYLREQAVSTE